ncbi:uncharacterized protein TNCV_5009351 [Trichonephila clavipes]|nr:uncharacterized protein TNCV_5009351 [Trichonephila clavipes]
MAKGMQLLRALSQLSLTSEHSHFAKTTEDGAMRMTNFDRYYILRRIVRVHYFVRGFVGHLSCPSSKHLSSHLPVDGARFLGGQNGVALQVQDARVGVRSTKKPPPLDVDVRRSDVTALAFSYRTFPLRKV